MMAWLMAEWGEMMGEACFYRRAFIYSHMLRYCFRPLHLPMLFVSLAGKSRGSAAANGTGAMGLLFTGQEGRGKEGS